ncbi:hypothetical protein ACH5RR_011327 [Cinchona calisaya]|uniref:Uncharacterized protein n=1 Tax=Cinchona calisaya TaxID=153742 RepID=A0ABD3A4J7_9GENT
MSNRFTHRTYIVTAGLRDQFDEVEPFGVGVTGHCNYHVSLLLIGKFTETSKQKELKFSIKSKIKMESQLRKTLRSSPANRGNFKWNPSSTKAEERGGNRERDYNLWIVEQANRPPWRKRRWRQLCLCDE